MVRKCDRFCAVRRRVKVEGRPLSMEAKPPEHDHRPRLRDPDKPYDGPMDPVRPFCGGKEEDVCEWWPKRPAVNVLAPWMRIRRREREPANPNRRTDA
jgi:hypothetical protein